MGKKDRQIATLAEWPTDKDEDVKYAEASEVAAVVRKLLGDHKELVNVDFIYAFVKNPFKSMGEQQPARISKIPPKYRWAFGHQIFFEVAWIYWRSLDKKQKEALVDRYLCHVRKDVDSGELRIVGADFIGFMSNLKKYGAHDAGLRMMVKVASQLPIPFDRDKDEAGAPVTVGSA